MNRIYRRGIDVGLCTTLGAMSKKLGGSPWMLSKHSERHGHDMPQKVATFGRTTLYVESELYAYYQSFKWQQSDRAFKDLTGDV